MQAFDTGLSKHFKVLDKGTVLILVTLLSHLVLHAAPPYDNVDKTPAYQFIEDSIAACNEIRKAGPQGYEQTLLPKKFEEHLKESFKKAKLILTQGGDALGVINKGKGFYEASEAVVQRKIMNAEVDLLEKDLNVLIRDNALTLEQWNLFHIRLVVLFEESLSDSPGYRPQYLDCWGITRAISSQSVLREFLSRHRSCGDKLYLKPFESCAISTFHELGIEELNRAFVEGVYPYGVVSQYSYADGRFYSPWVFLTHDANHLNTDLEYSMGKYPDTDIHESIREKRRLGREFIVNVLPKYMHDDQVKLSYAYFLLHHENLQELKKWNKINSKVEWLNSSYCNNSYHSYYSNGIGSRISDCHDLGSLLPPEVAQLLAGTALPISIMLEQSSYVSFKAPDPIEKFYFESRALFCREWAKFRWPDDTRSMDSGL